ncbi:MAG TPA: PAS domain S-box protein, partial [Polyangiaceae bacterium]|nr:PAS domain S-box protein [Polyangiaceae bacterium]
LTLVDVTAVKEREEKLRQLSAIVETSEDAIVAEDLHGKVTAWNGGAVRLYGYSEEEAVGHAMDMIVPPDLRDELVDMRRRINLGERVEPIETVRRRKQGALVDVSLSVSPLYDEHGRVVGLSAIGRDITRRRRAEAQVQRALEQRDRFIALLSHELRNPLMGVTMAVATLAKENADAERKDRALQALDRQTSHMARLLDDLVDVARARRGTISMRKELFDLRGGLETALDAVRERAAMKGIELVIDAASEPMWVYGDAARLQQLEVNLLSNAVKFTPGGKRVWFKVSNEQGEAQIRVADEGIGLRPGTEGEIFEPFYQDERAVDGGGRGMGLGLALVRGLAEAHGGSVVATSAGLGRGTEFVVRLPLAQAPASVRRPTDLAPARRRVLIVEDEDDNRQLLTLLLTDCGYEVTAAATGAEALDVLSGMPIEVALVDLGLPDMSGLEVAEKARQLVPRDALLLVALTGQGRAQDRDDVMAAGFDEHLMKPVRPEKILRVIERQA